MGENGSVLTWGVTLVVVVALAGASGAGAASSVLTCGLHRGFVVYAQGVTCPTAKKIVRRIDELPYRTPKVTVRSIPGFVCVATYKKTTKRMKAGSCLKIGTQATGFGWTKDGATVPLPPGASAAPTTS